MGRSREVHLHVMLDDDEAAAVGRMAREDGVTRASLVRTLIRANDAARDAAAFPVVVIDRQTYARHVRLVRSRGQLMNQSTRALNAIARIVREHGVEPLDLLEALEGAMRLQEATLDAVHEVQAREGEICGRTAVREG